MRACRSWEVKTAETRGLPPGAHSLSAQPPGSHHAARAAARPPPSLLQALPSVALSSPNMSRARAGGRGVSVSHLRLLARAEADRAYLQPWARQTAGCIDDRDPRTRRVRVCGMRVFSHLRGESSFHVYRNQCRVHLDISLICMQHATAPPKP